MNKTTAILLGTGILLATTAGIYFVIKNQNKAKAKAIADYEAQKNGYINNQIPINAQEIAKTLYDAMQGTGKSSFSSIGQNVGTDVALIMETLGGITPTQFIKVSKAFGNLNYNPISGNQRFLPFAKVTKYPLKFWLKNELTPQDYALLKTRFKTL